MKKFMKKLAAFALAGAMALSLSVGALATEQNGYGSGSSQGKGENESNKLDSPVRVTLPTSSATVFNMKLDPHGLIEDTKGARYSNAKFDYSTKLYFLTSTTGEGANAVNNWSGNSETLYVENKGDMDISLGLDLKVDKGNSKFDFVGSSADLADATNASMYLALVSGDTVRPVVLITEMIPDAEITVAEADAEKQTKEVDLVSDAAWAYDSGADDDDQDAFEDALGNGISVDVTYSDTGTGVDEYLIGDLELEGYTVTKTPTDGDLSNATAASFKFNDGSKDIGTLTLTIEAAATVHANGGTALEEADNAKNTVTLKLVADDSQTPSLAGITKIEVAPEDAEAQVIVAELVTDATFEFDASADDDAKEALQSALDEGVSVDVEVSADSTGIDSYTVSSITAPTGYTVTMTPTDGDVSSATEATYLFKTDAETPATIGTLTLELTAKSDLASLFSEGDSAKTTVTLTIGEPGGGKGQSSIKTSILKTANAYENKYDEATDSYKRSPVATVTEFKKVAFYLTGDINGVDAWDDNGSDVTIDVIWNIVKYDAVNYNDEVGSEGPEGGPSGLEGDDPTVRMTTKPTGTTGTARATVLTYVSGTEDKAAYVPYKITYKASGASTVSELTPTVNETAKTVSFNSAASIQNGSDWKLVFHVPDDSAAEISVAFSYS